MNIKIFATSAVFAAVSMSFGMETWVGAYGEYRIETGFDDGTNTYGYWYDFNDEDDGGTSSIAWPVAKGNAYSDNAMDPIIDHCGGVCGTATMGEGYQYPYVGIGFNVGGKTQAGFDISSWGGIQISYKSTGIAPFLEIAPADEQNVTGYNNFKAALKNSSTMERVFIPWSNFKQESGWGKKVDQATVLASAAAVKFKMAAVAGKSTEFNVSLIAEYNRTCCAIQSAKGASALKASVFGRTLAISGLKAGSTVEVINLQGRIVMKSLLNASSASLNLASMDAGVYMVHVVGKANMNQKIILK